MEDKQRFGAGSQSESKVEAFVRFRFERGFQGIELTKRAGQRERRGRKGSLQARSLQVPWRGCRQAHGTKKMRRRLALVGGELHATQSDRSLPSA